jgi:Domain of unknown function (DUF2703)
MLRIDFLFLDLATCTRCRAADRSLAVALEVARDVLTAAGTRVEVNKIRVESAAQARELGLVSSPTIRVNGRDIAHELRESPCGCEACTDGGGASIDCRVWVHRGREHSEPPVEMILDAILRELYAGPAVQRERAPYELPENLERFFTAKAAALAVPAAAEGAPCCSPAEQATCCEAENKAECCGTATGTGCGCR